MPNNSFDTSGGAGNFELRIMNSRGRRHLNRYMASSATQRISSHYTGIMKLIPVPLISAAVVFAALGIAGRTLPLFPDGALVLTFTLAALAFFTWHSYRLKFVTMDNDKLYVSGWFKHSAIPLSSVENIYYSAGVGLVFVRLKAPSVFGSTITFMPTLDSAIRSALKSPSIVDELKGLVKNASKSDGAT